MLNHFEFYIAFLVDLHFVKHQPMLTYFWSHYSIADKFDILVADYIRNNALDKLSSIRPVIQKFGILVADYKK